MDASLQKYLGPQKVAALEEYLDDLVSRPETQCPIVGYGIWPCDESYRYARVEATSNAGSLWSHIVRSVRGVISEAMAEGILADIDDDIHSKLSPEQLPPRVSYGVDDDSNTLYRAKSRIIRGTLRESRGTVEPRASEEGSDPTPLASPRGGFVTKTVFVEVELTSEGSSAVVSATVA